MRLVLAFVEVRALQQLAPVARRELLRAALVTLARHLLGGLVELTCGLACDRHIVIIHRMMIGRVWIVG